ncbi:hypothetical protein BpHYR1_005520 [Brachionus plicatilis]|uniref:Uncharacterized protein n=1 Tax=Brachionus plicatilis TaxID=10195 RepID=A0A3M7SE32_BRAPC|nr:hypothetical protein BpHYR1_005520 [Brachionus plicatilis]
MTILSKKQPGTSSGSAQSANDSSNATSTSTISLQPIQVVSESGPGAEEPTEPKQTLQLFPVKVEPGEAAGLQAKSPLSPNKKTKKSNKRKIKSPNVTINNFVSVNQSSLSSVLSSSASSCSSSVSSNGSLGFNLNFSDADQTEYYRLSDDSDYEEINSENDFFNSSEVKKSSKDPKCKKITKFSSNLLGTLPSNGLSSKCSKMKRNKNTEIKTGDIFNENNNSEDEYEQTPTLLINQEEAFIKSAKTIEELLEIIPCHDFNDLFNASKFENFLSNGHFNNHFETHAENIFWSAQLSNSEEFCDILKSSKIAGRETVN